jgi:hypothetical protein
LKVRISDCGGYNIQYALRIANYIEHDDAVVVEACSIMSSKKIKIKNLSD